MRGDLTIRQTKTSSSATAVQVVRNRGKKREVLHHVGSAHTADELSAMLKAAEIWAEQHREQPSLFVQVEPVEPQSPAFGLSDVRLVGVTHRFARDILMACASRCGLGDLPELYRDLALMRIIEPTSKLRTIELLQQYFNVRYAQRTVYRALPKLLEMQGVIEEASTQTARQELDEAFNLVLYDVTTLYFESFKDYDLQRPGFSKDNKPQQPQIVVGLITTRSGFPLMHEVFEGNTFEGHTMLEIVGKFQKRVGQAKPVIVADAAMLSKDNMLKLGAQGYRYFVGARLANASSRFIEQIHAELPRLDKANQRFEEVYDDNTVTTICEYSEVRYKKDRRDFERQIARALHLLERNEPGSRAKFIRKAGPKDKPFVFDTALKAKTEKLLGIKGYVTNIPEQDLSNAEVIDYYHSLWKVEQTFRMTKSDLRTRPIFHYTQDAIRAHMLICFMALMMGKLLEIKTGLSLRRIRNALWKVHEAHMRDERTGKVHVLRMETDDPEHRVLLEFLKDDFPH